MNLQEFSHKNKIRCESPAGFNHQLEDWSLADEIADTFIYLDLLAQSQGWDLANIVQNKWNKTSKKIGYTA
jgi:hypothetical protein